MNTVSSKPHPALDPACEALFNSTFDLASFLNAIGPRALDPAFHAQIEALSETVNHLLQLRAAVARLAALKGLEEATRAAETPLEARRAASALLRATSAPLFRAVGLTHAPLPGPGAGPTSSTPGPATKPEPLIPRRGPNDWSPPLRSDTSPPPPLPSRAASHSAAAGSPHHSLIAPAPRGLPISRQSLKSARAQFLRAARNSDRANLRPASQSRDAPP